MKLINDWSLSWKFLSVQAAALLVFLSVIQADVLPVIQPLFSPEVWSWVTGFIAVLIVIARVIAQPGLEPERDQIALDELDELEKQMDTDPGVPVSSRVAAPTGSTFDKDRQ
jgi:hypothetical protein